MRVKSRAAAFTLVELLVVIGIIALLISMLLPALNKARQQANSVDCMARLRQMGQALQIYTVNSKGYLPYSIINRTETWVSPKFTPSPSDAESTWWWYFTLGQIMNPRMVGSDGLVANLPGVFADKDTIEATSAQRYTNHYTANPRIFVSNSSYDNDFAPEVFFGGPEIVGVDHRPRRVTNTKLSTTFVVWDSSQIQEASYGGNSYGLAIELDQNQWTYGHAFCLGSPNTAVNYSRPVVPGNDGVFSQNAVQTKAAQIKFNRDQQTAFGSDGYANQLRFRHLNNKSLNALCPRWTRGNASCRVGHAY